MIKLFNAEWLASLIVLIIAYFFSVTINGIAQAWVAKKMGDTTAEKAGFLSLDPFVHFDPVSFGALLWFHLGWPRFIPVNPFYVFSDYWLLRLFVIHSTEFVVSMGIAIVSLVLSISFSGIGATIQLLYYMFAPHSIVMAGVAVARNAPLYVATHTIMPYASSLTIICALFLVSCVILNVFISALSIIFNSFKYVLVVGLERGYKYMHYADSLAFIGPLIIMLFFINPLRSYLLRTIITSAHFIVSLYAGAV